jgi:ribosomal protein L4
MKLDVQSLDGKKGGSVDLDDAIFGIKEVRGDILQRMVKYQLALEDLQAKRHGPGASRRGQRSDLPRRWSRPQSPPPRLLA